MTTLHAEEALTSDGWRSDVRMTVAGGIVRAIKVGVPAEAGDERHAIVLPGMPNLHSHAFQRGMAGLAERRGPSADSFWSWREVMYRFALSMRPDQVNAVAAQLYAEMLEAGFTRVGEFHYLHHDSDGRPYGDIAEMAGQICGAAAETGIGLTLLPVFYAHSGFGGAPFNEGQRRFGNDLERYQRLLDGARHAAAAVEGSVVGIAPHSLRAVTLAELTDLLPMAQGGPVHLHIAEQTREVEDCVAWSGQRPVEWLFNHLAVDSRWCLIHATHMTDAETDRMAHSGAIAGLCPITEANLGDGTFNAVRFRDAGGRYGIGSDSNILIGVAEELRQLEYSQRLVHRARNVLAVSGGSTGRALLDGALDGGVAALGVSRAGLSVGASADLVTLNADHPALIGRKGDTLLDAFVFAGGNSMIDCVFVRGIKQVECGRHRKRAEILARFRRVMQELCAA